MSRLLENDLREAANQLNRSERGRKAMQDLLTFLDNGGLTLDASNQHAAFTLLLGAWGEFPQTARDAMREQLEAAV